MDYNWFEVLRVMEEKKITHLSWVKPWLPRWLREVRSQQQCDPEVPEAGGGSADQQGGALGVCWV